MDEEQNENPLDHEERHQFYGRMMECCDIALFIESGQCKSLDSLLDYANKRSAFLVDLLAKEEFFGGIRMVSPEEYAARVAFFDVQALPGNPA